MCVNVCACLIMTRLLSVSYTTWEGMCAAVAAAALHVFSHRAQVVYTVLRLSLDGLYFPAYACV